MHQPLLTLVLSVSLIPLTAQSICGRSNYFANGEVVINNEQTTLSNHVNMPLDASHVSRKSGPQTTRRRDQLAIGFCKLVRNPGLYNQRLIRTEATMIVGYEQSYLYDPACNSADTWSWAEHDRSYESNPETQAFLDSLLDNKVGVGAGRAKVTVVGRFEASLGKRYGHLDQFRSQFVIMRVERAEEVRTNVAWPWEDKEDAPLSKAEQAVRNLNNAFMLYYAGARISRIDLDSLDDDLADDFTFTDARGDVKSRSQFIELSKTLHFAGRIINKNSKVQIFGDRAVATGRVVKSEGKVIAEQFSYTSRYVKRKGRWEVLALKVTSEATASIH